MTYNSTVIVQKLFFKAFEHSVPLIKGASLSRFISDEKYRCFKCYFLTIVQNIIPILEFSASGGFRGQRSNFLKGHYRLDGIFKKLLKSMCLLFRGYASFTLYRTLVRVKCNEQ